MERISSSTLGLARLVLLPALLLWLPAAPAEARGTAYRGPDREVPQLHREGSDPPPPPHPSGCTCSPDTGPELAPPTEAELRRIRELEARIHTLHLDDWAFWWNRARDRYLRPPSRPVPDRAWVRGELIPALRARLADTDEHFEVRAAAALELGRLDDQDAAPLLLEVVRDDDPRGSDRVAREAAQLALGLLGAGGEARAELERRVRSRTTRREFVRPHAAVALGLHARRRGGDEALRDVLGAALSERTRERALGPAAALGLGLSGVPGAGSRLMRVVELGTRAPDGSRALPETTVTWAVTALALHAEGGGKDDRDRAVPLLAERLRGGEDSTHPRNVRRAAVLGLARLGELQADEVRELATVALLHASAQDEDRTVRRFARLTLARFHAAEPDGRIVERLATAPADGSTCLALGLAARGSGESKSRGALLARLVELHTETTDTRIKVAAVLGRALAGDGRIASTLDEWGTGSDPFRAGYAIQAAALLGTAPGPGVLKAAASPKSLDPRGLLALGCLSAEVESAPLIPLLTTDPELRDWSDHQYVVTGAGRAIADLRDEATLRELLGQVPPDPERPVPPLLRATIVWTLGRASATSEDTTWPDLARDTNHRAYADAIDELSRME